MQPTLRRRVILLPSHNKTWKDGCSCRRVDLRELSLKDLRANVGVVSEEPLLFDTSVLENIRFGRPDLSGAAVTAASHHSLDLIVHQTDVMNSCLEKKNKSNFLINYLTQLNGAHCCFWLSYLTIR